MRVANCQVASTRDLRYNREVAARLVSEQAGAGVELIVLPEATLCTFGTPGRDEPQPAEPLDGPFVSALVAAVTDTSATVVAGTFTPILGLDLVHNVLVVVDSSGVRATYRKQHLYDALGWEESAVVRAGDPVRDGVAVVDVAGVPVGILTCYDLRFPETGRVLADAGAELLVVPAAWVAGEGKVEQWRVLLQARAMENTLYVAGVGQPGPTYCGTSMVVDPRGHVLAALGPDGADTLVAPIDRTRVAEVRRALPLLTGRRYQVTPRPD